MRAFLLGGLRPGFKVSLGGRPFTDDRARLLATLNQLARGPFGANGLPGLVDWRGTWGMMPRKNARWPRRSAARRMASHRCQASSSGPNGWRVGSIAQPMLTVGRADRSLPVYGDVTFNQYYDLVERLAALPGKKAVVLMRPGLRLEHDNQGLFQDLASFAVRRRVSFYTVDSRGLDASLPVDERIIPRRSTAAAGPASRT